MKIISITIVLVGIALLFFASSCKAKKYTNIEEADINKITFSEGGGFTGSYTTYTLLENGQLFKSQGAVTEYKEISSVDQTVTDQIFATYNNLKLDKRSDSDVGNWTFTIEMQDKKKNHKLSWAKSDENAKKLQTYFDTALKMIDKENKGTKQKFELKQ